LALNFDWQHRRKAVDSRDPKRVLTMVCFPAHQFNTAKKQFMATRKVPIADRHDLEDRSLVVVVRNARAVTQITASFSLA
jgi:hypothetical protein